jgi:hypothetical protein
MQVQYEVKNTVYNIMSYVHLIIILIADRVGK